MRLLFETRRLESVGEPSLCLSREGVRYREESRRQVPRVSMSATSFFLTRETTNPTAYIIRPNLLSRSRRADPTSIENRSNSVPLSQLFPAAS